MIQEVWEMMNITSDDIRATILRDDLYIKGTDCNTLEEATQIIDEYTTVEKLDYSNVDIWHYGKKTSRYLYFIPLNHNDEEPLKIKKCTSKGVESIRLMGPECIYIDGYDLAQSDNHAGYELQDEIEQDSDNKFGRVFYFAAKYGRNEDLVLFTSPLGSKTMHARLQVRSQDVEIGHDLLLHADLRERASVELQKRDAKVTKLLKTEVSNLQEKDHIKQMIDKLNTDPLIGFDTVMRGTGKYRKMVGIFADCDRIPFHLAVKAITQHAGTTCFDWQFAQEEGLLAMFSYNGFDKVLKSKNIKYRPAIHIQICDSGNISSRLSVGWYDPRHPAKSVFWTHQYVLKSIKEDAQTGALTIIAVADDKDNRPTISCDETVWLKDLEGDLETMQAWQDYCGCTTAPENKAIYMDWVEHFLDTMGFKDVGAKVRTALQEYMVNALELQMNPIIPVTWYLLFQLYISGMIDCVETENINAYAARLLHGTNTQKLFNDKTHWSASRQEQDIIKQKKQKDEQDAKVASVAAKNQRFQTTISALKGNGSIAV